MTIRARYLVIPAALALLVTGCDKDSTGGTGGIVTSGKVSFSYSGDLSGAFSAEGAVPMQNQTEATWAMALRDTEFDELAVWANRTRAGGKFDQVIVTVPNSGTGQFVVGELGENDAFVQLHIGITGTNVPTAEAMCDVIDGVVTVASVSDDRVRGSFSGTASCVDGELNEIGEIQIASGQFDTPVYDSDDV